ncbi:unnamed protein product [Spirodela intermedia]|uniref:Uncharacterized protein n=2 Tax=Spirodela intermedia TaxID=51605 RepID=A0A7I8IT67_SPIIN|nr:unnamed protein product [Spirodela intermedia]CAA6660730.1 unnamed protein product [Spirodela intermedia]CAA7397097.1 unnamed protein product [Spirodela intermedia]
MGAAAFPLLRPSSLAPRPLPARSRRSVPLRRRTLAANPASRRWVGFLVLAESNGNGLTKEDAPPLAGGEPARGDGESRGTPPYSAEGDGGDGGRKMGSENPPPPPPPPPPPGRAASTGGIRWRELLLAPDPDNVLAVGLTGILAWASLQVLWQLVFISLAILVAALKYSFIAALLLFILITLL